MYSEDLHILQKSSVNLLRSIPRNLLRENERSFCWILLFLQNVKKSTQNYAYPISSRIVTDANEIFFEIESDRNDFFPLFRSVNYNQSIMPTYEISRFSSLLAAWDVSQRETSPTSIETSQAVRRGARKGCFRRLYMPERAD